MNKKTNDESIAKEVAHRQRAIGLFANPSKEFLRLNPTIAAIGETCPWCGGKGCSSCAHGQVPRWMRAEKSAREMSAPALNPSTDRRIGLILRLIGQVRGGKNAMGVTKSGRHYARPAFKAWRADAVRQIKWQIPTHFVCITTPSNVRFDYVAGDKKRRDMTGILDAIFHLLEYCGVIHDDSLLWVVESSRSYDKANPGATITFL